MEKSPVAATIFSPYGSLLKSPSECLNWHIFAHIAAFSARSPDQVRGGALWAARTVLCPARKAGMSAELDTKSLASALCSVYRGRGAADAKKWGRKPNEIKIYKRVTRNIWSRKERQGASVSKPTGTGHNDNLEKQDGMISCSNQRGYMVLLRFAHDHHQLSSSSASGQALETVTLGTRIR